MSSGAIRMPSPLELATGTNTSLTRHGTIIGTLQYMSPEQWGIGIEIDHRTDIWACGIMLFRMICGRHPLHPLDGNQLVVTAMLELPMPSMAEAAPPDVPRELIQIVDRCLLKNKEQRWQRPPSCCARSSRSCPAAARAQLQLDESPYAGLSSFQEADAGRFFGRSREIAAMVTRIRERPLMASSAARASASRRSCAPASCPRSSARASVGDARHPPGPQAAGGARRRSSRRWSRPRRTSPTRWTSRRSSSRRCATSPATSAPAARSRAPRQPADPAVRRSVRGALHAGRRSGRARRVHRVLVGVADDATSPLRVVLSIRSDFLDRVAEDPAVHGRADPGPVLPRPPNREGLRDALLQPAEMAGFRFEAPAMVEDMLDTSRPRRARCRCCSSPRASCGRRATSRARMLTHQSYAAMGGIAGALASHADRVVQELGPPKSGADPRDPAAPGHAGAHPRDRPDRRAARAVARGRRGPAPRRSAGRGAPARRPDRSRAARARRSRSSTSR